MHVLPQLRELERTFERELIVIGVHSGKFTAERVTENIRQAVLRLRVDHPVVNDRQFRVWRSYAVNAWPTLALIDPDGRHVGSHVGEVTAASVAPTIQALIADFDSRGKIDRSEVRLQPERLRQPVRQLAFPGKILATEDGRLIISDSGHNRLLVVRLSEDSSRGTVEAIIGKGSEGLADGEFHAAAFRYPQGLALVAEQLYVADTENHAIRGVDLEKRRVYTIAGIGEQARRVMKGGLARASALSSPWDILLHNGSLYVAMSGSHQIWRLDLASGEIHVHAGTGYEALADGPLLGASLAQPSGLASDGKALYFADSESSAIRRADFSVSGVVKTVVGTGLFNFGDVDGAGDQARLQHPLGLTWYDGRLYVADTYNNKVKVIDPSTRMASTFAGTGDAGDRDGDQATFDEPGGITVSRGRLFVADTNNHKIRVTDVSRRRVSSLDIHGV